MKKRIFAYLALIPVLVAPVWAHHNMTALFDFDQRFTRTGTLIEIDWRNPHVKLTVDANSDQDRVETWLFEGPSPKFFRTRDVGKSHFENAIGETVTVEASRARNGALSGLMRMITLPDGSVISLCPQNC
ncbi:MAG: DUF6152 family protein [Gammaproteobacteria bacterium]|nr:DUF6152 family protein [Gammaproteobacteria bacterium]